MFDRLVDIILSFLHLFKFWTVVLPYEQGLCILLGKWVRVIGPGLHLVAPFRIDEVFVESTVLRSVEVAPQSLTTSDGTTVVVTPEILCHISDIKTYLIEMDEPDDVVANVVKQKVADHVRQRTWDELQDSERLSDEITTSCRHFLTRRGVKIDAVVLTDFVKARSYRLWESQSSQITL